MIVGQRKIEGDFTVNCGSSLAKAYTELRSSKSRKSICVAMPAIKPTVTSEENNLAEWLRAELINKTVKDVYLATADANDLQLKALSGDAGMRRYFHIKGLDSCLAVYAPPQTENSTIFVNIAEFMRQQGVRTPRIYAVDYERGYLLIENLGERLLLPELNSDSVESLYGESLLNLLTLQQSKVPPEFLPAYSQEKLLQELMLFPQWFVEKLLGHSLNKEENKNLEEFFSLLVDSALEQPQCFVHRDYHSRNIILSDVGAPGVIDFQDAVVGPITYDVVSLLKDCYVRWPVQDVEKWLTVYANMAIEMGLLPTVSKQTLLRWFDWMGLQRHIKVLGIFSRLYLRDNKSSYLHDLPLVIRYVVETLENYPEFETVRLWFQEKVLPLAEQQMWYTDFSKAGE